MGVTNSLALNSGGLAVLDGLLSRLALLEKRLRDEDLLSSGGGPVCGNHISMAIPHKMYDSVEYEEAIALPLRSWK